MDNRPSPRPTRNFGPVLPVVAVIVILWMISVSHVDAEMVRSIADLVTAALAFRLAVGGHSGDDRDR